MNPSDLMNPKDLMNPITKMTDNPSPFDPAQLLDLAHPVDLDPELQPYVGTVPGLGFPVLRHPLLYAVPFKKYGQI